MFEEHAALFLWTETPLHAGSGSTVGVIDLPIQRDRQTQHPIVQASGIKGALRDHCRQVWNVPASSAAAGTDETEEGGESPVTEASTVSADGGKWVQKREWEAIFGPEKGDLFGGAVAFSEARLVLFPVRSLKGVWAWITCPLVLARLQRDLNRAGIALPPLPPEPADATAIVMSGSHLLLGEATGGGNAQNAAKFLVLEEFTFTANTSQDTLLKPLADWLTEYALPAKPLAGSDDPYAFWRKRLEGGANKSQLVILSDNDFTDFVLYATNVDQRIRIEWDTGIVAEGALWTEESLPTDCLLCTILHAMPPRQSKKQSVPDSLRENDDPEGLPSAQKVREKLIGAFAWPNELVQLGGDETVGRGLTRMRALLPTPFTPGQGGTS